MTSIWLQNAQTMSSRSNRLREKANDMPMGIERELVENEADLYQRWSEDHERLHFESTRRKREEALTRLAEIDGMYL